MNLRAAFLALLVASHGAALRSQVAPEPLRNPDRFSGTTVTAANGDEFDVTFTDPSRPGQKVTVTAKHPTRKDTFIEFEIQLDSKGRGKTKWSVPQGWLGAVLTEPSSADHGVIVTP